MEFKITEAEARAMARFEEEVGCNLSAGPDYGIHLGKVMALALNQVEVDREDFVALLSQKVGNVLSQEEIEEVASSFQAQIQERVAGKVASHNGADLAC
jgi:serine/threonine protein phosphatase PrpC